MAKLLDYEDLSKLVFVSSPSIHPNTKYVAFLVTKINLRDDRYESAIWVYDSSKENLYPLTSGPEDLCPCWSPSGEYLSFVSRRGLKEEDKGASLFLLSVGKEPWKLAYFEGGIISYAWSPNSRKIALISKTGKPHDDVKVIEKIPIWRNGEGFTYNTVKKLFVVDVYSGYITQVTDNRLDITTFAWSYDSRKLAYSIMADELKPYESRIRIIDLETLEETELPIYGFSIDFIQWSPRGNIIAFIGRDLRGRRGLASHRRVYLYDLDTNNLELLTSDIDRSTANTLGSDSRWKSCSPLLKWVKCSESSNGCLYFFVSDSGKVSLYKARLHDGKISRAIYLEDSSVDEFDVSIDGKNIAFTAMSPDHPRELFIAADGNITRLTSFNDEFVKTYRLQKPEHFKFRASDGAEIDGWILWPPKESLKKNKTPWILYIHGGPKAMYGDGFYFEFHLLAHKGFAVVYTNPRGSDGYSEEFADIRCHYGERDYQDLIEAVDYVLSKYNDKLDNERIGVAGGSYGGFMVNWIITHTDRFRAAVTQRSISNWISKYGTTDIGFYFNAEMIGCGQPPWENIQAYLEKSPIMHVHNAKTPTLIIHSIEDYRCWVDQAIEFFTALKIRGVETKLVLFPGENHELSRSGKPKHRVERLKYITRWFLRYLYNIEENETK